jgi:Cu2+-exporting ATPase
VTSRPVIDLSKATYRKIRTCGGLPATIVAIPVAAGLLARCGIVLPPAVEGVLISLGTVIVAINAQLLRRVLEPDVY